LCNVEDAFCYLRNSAQYVSHVWRVYDSFLIPYSTFVSNAKQGWVDEWQLDV